MTGYVEETMRLFSNLNLSQKFSVTLLLLLLAPIIVVSILVSHYISVNNYRQTCDARFALLEQVSGNLENFTNDAKYVSLNILSDAKTQSLLKDYRDPTIDAVGRQTLTVGFSVQPLLESRNYVEAISLYDDEGIIYQYGLRIEAEDMQYVEAVKEAEGRPFWTAAYKQVYPGDYYYRYLDGEYVVSLLRGINDLGNYKTMLGIERITFDEAYIEALYSGIMIGDGRMYIVNRDGEVVSSTDKSMLGSNLSGGGRFAELFGNSGYFEQDGNVVLHTVQDSPDWSLVMEEPKSVFLSGQKEVTLLTFFNILVVVFFGIAFLLVQNRSIIRPVSLLSKDAQNYREGNFRITTQSRSNDEIGQLNRSLREMNEYIRNLIEQEYKSKLSEREMELEYLQSQINPHFLYNTLDNIRWMAVMENQQKIADNIEALCNLFRHSLNSGNKYTTLEEEIKSLESYILLQRARFEDSIFFEIRVEEDLLPCRIIKLVIQPLVENAIVHGIEPKLGKGHIRILIDRWEGKMRCRVTDDGIGIDAEAINKYINGEWDAGRSFALKNIHDRIQLEYGKEYGFSIQGSKNKGSVVRLLLPILYKTDEE
ncbi:sensor histidine kinase [Christensenella hongkongensis]|uniref:sensor histidine kinase n=1 Tax=Christensenella hongkongensis TaxID=270498 RepID=UPI0009EABCD0|nr:sensor histidine kinase [Christensenella hongkongensis]